MSERALRGTSATGDAGVSDRSIAPLPATPWGAPPDEHDAPVRPAGHHPRHAPRILSTHDAARGARHPRVAAIAALAMAAMLSTAATAHAQRTADYRRLVDSLAVEWRRTVAAEARDDSVMKRGLPHDTVRVGPLRIVTEPSRADMARKAAAEALPEIEATFGSAVSVLTAHPILLRSSGDSGITWRGAVEVALLDSASQLHSESSEMPEVHGLASAIRHRAAEVATATLDPALRDWIGREVPTRRELATVWPDVRVNLVTVHSAAAHQCFEGSLGRCREVLGVVPVDDPAMTWYDAAQRRAIVRHAGWTLRASGGVALFDRCDRAGERAACDSLVHLLGPRYVPQPLDANARQALMHLALSMGGPDAFTRLSQAKGTVEERLAATAGVSADSLVSAWRANVLTAHATGAGPLDGATALSAAAWATLFGALALRSSRWR